MIYLKSFKLLNKQQEQGIIFGRSMNIHTSYYPLGLFTKKEFEDISFDTITIFYGGNGSGKTTLLNIISSALKASKRTLNKLGDIFYEYVMTCTHEMIHQTDCKDIKYISSDDVFDCLLDMRAINSSVNRRKEDLIDEYFDYKYNPSSKFNSSLEQLDELKNKVDANRMTASKYVRTRLRNNTIEQESNGETALDFWQNEITDNSIYIIDEPENSLSAENQLKLKSFIEESARFYNCQFIIATHSPFLLALKEAKIYDLDSDPVTTKRWTELSNIKIYKDFFQEHNNEFENKTTS